MSRFLGRRGRKGFTLVELAVVIVIIGVLASFGVPKFLQSVERSKASEAFNFLSAVRSAQERYQAKEGKYAEAWSDLDIAWKMDGTKPVLQYFNIPDAITSSAEDAWSATMTRKAGSSGFTAEYTVTFTQDGFDATNSTIPATVNPIGGVSSGSGSGGSGS